MTAGITAANFPKLIYSLDGGVWVTHQLQANTNRLFIANLAAGNHTFYGAFLCTVQTNDRWNTPVNIIKLTSVVLDGNAASVSPFGAISFHTTNLLVLGDSIVEGVDILANSGDLTSNDGTKPFSVSVAAGLGAELGNVGFGFQGYRKTGNGNVPILTSSWSNYSSGLSRLPLTPTPNWILVNMGTNDTTANSALLITSDVTTFIASIRAQSGLATVPLFMMVPFAGINRSTITTAVNTAQATDPNLYLLDLGTSIQIGLTALANGASYQSFDGLHPNTLSHAVLANMVTAQIKTFLAASSPNGYY